MMMTRTDEGIWHRARGIITLSNRMAEQPTECPIKSPLRQKCSVRGAQRKTEDTRETNRSFLGIEIAFVKLLNRVVDWMFTTSLRVWEYGRYCLIGDKDKVLPLIK